MLAQAVADLVHDALLHAPPRVEEALLDGGSWHSEEGSDVSQRAVGRVEERDDDPFALRQSRDLCLTRSLSSCASARPLGSGCSSFALSASSSGTVGSLRPARRGRHTWPRCGAASAETRLVRAAWAGRDGPAEMLPGPLLGQVGVAQSSVGGREGQILVPPDELGERVDVTALGGSYDVRQLVHKDHFHRPSPRSRR